MPAPPSVPSPSYLDEFPPLHIIRYSSMKRRSLPTHLSHGSFVSNDLRTHILRYCHFLLSDLLQITFRRITIAAPIYHTPHSTLNTLSFIKPPPGTVTSHLQTSQLFALSFPDTLVSHHSSTPQLQHLIFSTRPPSPPSRRYHIVVPCTSNFWQLSPSLSLFQLNTNNIFYHGES